MEASKLRALQTPLKDCYRENPAAARAILKARGTLGPAGVTCKVETFAGPVEAGLRQREDGPPIEGGTVFVPGEVILFSCRLDGYQASKEKKIAISYGFSAVDPGGLPVIEPVTGKVEVEKTT